MTHGEEPGSETQQDSAVLTYLEGFLMHQAAGGPGGTGTRRSESGRGDQEQGDKVQGGLQLQNHAADPKQDHSTPAGGTTQHLKKARLLRSEAWGEREGQRSAVPVLDLNGQAGEALDGSPNCKGESTLLASLLQSFSSRLQTVALSQQIVQSLKQQDRGRADEGAREEKEKEEAHPCLGAASSRLKGLMKKSRIQTHNSVPFGRRASQERVSEPPQARLGGAPAAGPDPLSCAARLKAVASLVNTRPSPAPSPKPSVACSQLALLLSSEAHLQQYSRQQALKAQLSGRSASERLAAMVTQQTQDQQPSSAGRAQIAPDTLSSLNAKNGTLPPQALGSSKQNLTMAAGQGRGPASPRAPQPFRDRRPFDRHGGRPSQNCSSLLLHLLNNHNAQRRANGHLHGHGHSHSHGHTDLRDERSTFPSRGSPLPSDSEYSNPETSLPRDSSDAESSCSSSSPIDLSVRGRGAGLALGFSSSSSSSSSLDRLTESLINKWRPENPPPTPARPREPEAASLMKPHHKVTLLQLLLDHKNTAVNQVNRSTDNLELRQGLSPQPSGVGVGVSRQTPATRCEEARTQSPQSGHIGKNLQSPPTFSYGQDSNGSGSPYRLYASPPAQTIPLNLCKSKPSPGDGNAQEPAFSASILLQNLAQCGLKRTASSPPSKTPAKKQTLDLKGDQPVTLLERLSAPIMKNSPPVADGPRANSAKVPFVPEPSPPVSEIENLLERRTVLQLLLGTASNKEKPVCGKRKRTAAQSTLTEEQPEKSESHGSLNGPPLDIKIKMEPREESPLSDYEEESEWWQRRGGEDEKCPPQRDVKPEPLSPETVPKYGLLSQLLKQQTKICQLNMQTGLHSGTVKEEVEDVQGPAIPKKRKFCAELEDRLSGEPFMSSGSSDSTPKDGSDNGHAISSMAEGQKLKKLESLDEANSPATCPVSESLPNDSRGFNVLKQLLLSDNCLKDLAQPGGSGSPSSPQVNFKVNGNVPSKPAPSHGLTHLRRDLSPPSDFQVVNGVSTSRSLPASPPWGVHTPARHSPKLNLVPIKRDAEGPVQWVVSGEERHDSPRLTRSNPILYYMLQKGGFQLGRERRGREEGPCGGLRVREKQETADHGLSSKHLLHLPDERPGGTVERHNGSLKKC
ncbi:nuclear receptor-interacting protein 1 [Megalops cyprinoides]|uniref:nuclear receptor-interacting protein 1 n=1 Tax=Megalops cyprinoides TaxID=118141 RepID=UPI001864EBBA|nr:nuclear receptor-interacting protein 1 [Megalops cyprinoides]XP_036393434.1 nuclear receptor-interacting protein 1 [Megalops cyprinoides]XP_036393435.1 nuclear receptor-interacting protein 1 [Megalops cyprinoides]